MELTKISKPTIIVTSLGRTGTQFFAALFRDILPGATTLHEPDVFNFFQYEGMNERLRQTVKQVQEVGFYHLSLRKALGSGSVIELSDSRVRGKLQYSEAARRLRNHRSRFVQTREGILYVESNPGYYALVDVLSDVYRHHRVAYIVRDGRDWVRSNMNWGQMYGKGRFRNLIAHTWPIAPEIEGDPYQARWKSMSRFEKLCWAWATLNGYALRTISGNQDARVFRFEEIFESKNRYEHLQEMVRFLTALPDVQPIDAESLAAWPHRKIHKSHGHFPGWREWTPADKQSFRTLCGPLMENLGYGLE